jgi:hypothetical protein
MNFNGRKGLDTTPEQVQAGSFHSNALLNCCATLAGSPQVCFIQQLFETLASKKETSVTINGTNGTDCRAVYVSSSAGLPLCACRDLHNNA